MSCRLGAMVGAVLLQALLATQLGATAAIAETTDLAVPVVPAVSEAAPAGPAPEVEQLAQPLPGDPARGRLVFGQCRTCHYPEPAMGHNNGPNLHRIFGRVAGKQSGFDAYSPTFREATFVWTPRLMYAWLENPMAMFPGSSMMSLGVPDPQRRADLIAYLEQASTQAPPAAGQPAASEQPLALTPDDYRATVTE